MRKYILILSCAMLAMIFATCTLFDVRRADSRRAFGAASPPGVPASPGSTGTTQLGDTGSSSPGGTGTTQPGDTGSSSPGGTGTTQPGGTGFSSPTKPTRASQYPHLIGTWELPTETPSIASLQSIQIELKRSIEITADLDVLIERIDGSIKDTQATPLFQAIEGIQVETYTIVTITDSQLELRTTGTEDLFTERADIKALLAQFPITEADLDFVAPRMIGTTLAVPYTYSSAAQTLVLDWKGDGNGAEYTKKSPSP